jgi:hypothetical protein
MCHWEAGMTASTRVFMHQRGGGSLVLTGRGFFVPARRARTGGRLI